MIVLIISACLLSNPNSCYNYNLTFDGDPRYLTPMKCIMKAQHRMAEWNKIHPNLRISRFKCTTKDHLEAKI